jgi:cyclic pyranopterin phosphate synthase
LFGDVVFTTEGGWAARIGGFGRELSGEGAPCRNQRKRTGRGAKTDAKESRRCEVDFLREKASILDMPKLTHLTKTGNARMVDVGHKPVTWREAVAEGFITLKRSTLQAIASETLPKGEALSTARLAGIMAAKRTGDLIPLCHPLGLDSVEVDFDIPDLTGSDSQPVNLRIKAIARISAKTGVEMEALTAVSVAALTIYDMCKAIDKTMTITNIHLVSKTGGMSRSTAPSSEIFRALATSSRKRSKRIQR